MKTLCTNITLNILENNGTYVARELCLTTLAIKWAAYRYNGNFYVVDKDRNVWLIDY